MVRVNAVVGKRFSQPETCSQGMPRWTTALQTPAVLQSRPWHTPSDVCNTWPVPAVHTPWPAALHLICKIPGVAVVCYWAGYLLSRHVYIQLCLNIVMHRKFSYLLPIHFCTQRNHAGRDKPSCVPIFLQSLQWESGFASPKGEWLGRLHPGC